MAKSQIITRKTTMAKIRKAVSPPIKTVTKKSNIEHAAIKFTGGVTWKGGVLHGKGTQTFENGKVIECDGWKDGKAHGKGKKTYASGHAFECEWKDGVTVGKGTETYPNGDVLECDGWEDEEPNGKGKYTYSNGSVFECTWKNGHENGKSVLTYPNGDKFEIEYKNGDLFGRGVKTYASRDVLTCDEWLEENGDSYSPNGKGILKYATKDEVEGEWEYGELQSGALYKTASGKIFSMTALT